MKDMEEDILPIKILWACTNFGVTATEEDIFAGEPIRNEIAHGVLHEICLISKLDIPNLERD